VAPVELVQGADVGAPDAGEQIGVRGVHDLTLRPSRAEGKEG
jgi:hypothetical protein